MRDKWGSEYKFSEPNSFPNQKKNTTAITPPSLRQKTPPHLLGSYPGEDGKVASNWKDGGDGTAGERPSLCSGSPARFATTCELLRNCTTRGKMQIWKTRTLQMLICVPLQHLQCMKVSFTPSVEKGRVPRQTVTKEKAEAAWGAKSLARSWDIGRQVGNIVCPTNANRSGGDNAEGRVYRHRHTLIPTQTRIHTSATQMPGGRRRFGSPMGRRAHTAADRYRGCWPGHCRSLSTPPTSNWFFLCRGWGGGS